MRGITRQLVVVSTALMATLDTVRKHLTHGFGKLGVTNRTQAIAHARQLQLIQ